MIVPVDVLMQSSPIMWDQCIYGCWDWPNWFLWIVFHQCDPFLGRAVDRSPLWWLVALFSWVIIKMETYGHRGFIKIQFALFLGNRIYLGTFLVEDCLLFYSFLYKICSLCLFRSVIEDCFTLIWFKVSHTSNYFDIYFQVV